MKTEDHRLMMHALITVILLAGCGGVKSTTVFPNSAAPIEPTSETPLSTSPKEQSLLEKQPETQSQSPKKESTPAQSPGSQEQPPSAGFNQQQELAVYEGPVEHIFFHPLIAYPELAFDQDKISKGYNDWFVTVKEFDRIIQSLYQNQYILIDINQLFEQKEVNGKITLAKKQLMLPKHKKPLILSIDDVNYYDYMLENGNVYKLILDEKGDVATYSQTPLGAKKIAYDNEIVPILDQFVKEHPDFSFNGAKGILALTGYQGVLGYRTQNLASPHYPSEKEAALKVIKRLKETGWTFAAHGYGHRDAKKVSYGSLAEDTKRWKKEVEPLIGPTSVYIYPYGSRVDTNSDKYRMLVKSGFPVLCGVGPNPYLKYMPDSMMMDRRHIDGISLQTQGNRMKHLFDSRQVIDSVRTPAQ